MSTLLCVVRIYTHEMRPAGAVETRDREIIKEIYKRVSLIYGGE